MIADAFNQDIFSTISLTKAINLLPTNPTRIGDLGIFAEEGVTKTTVMIEENNGILGLVPETRRGAPGTPWKSEKRTARTVGVGHISVEDTIKADDVQGVRAFGSETADDTIANLVNSRLASMRRSIDVTREYRRVRALHGEILDADGSTVLLDLFTTFGVSEQSIDFALGTATTNVRGKCHDVHRAMDDAVGGTMLVNSVHAICGSTWFDAFVNHDNVKAAYANWQAAADRLGSDVRSGFQFGGITFEEYRATVSGNAFVAADEARAFPIAPGMYAEYFGPADYIETVNTVGLPYYSKTANTKFDKGVDLEAQCNPLPLCFMPAALIEITTS